ncbi:hypothetical protein LARV_00047 [Longilinea arvoryzae]|uniref:DUF3467 domain-containing protein n=1 Tax=Longilinea arvoryzae TaxID=360412 RepID=A0A0S7BEV8_9CHLR|nr:DUF3467 domain-containing protein [Longilinea arvoryzae]GAP12315.1 hypothetical protein LARV_00047 [Longilinea arvoryzae]
MTEPTPRGLPPMELPADLGIVYSNVVRISHSLADFVFDFTHLLPGQESKVEARVVMSPQATKLLLRALLENLSRYEAANGVIQLPGDNSLATDLFRNIHPPE